MSSAGFQQLSKQLLATDLVLLIIPPLLTPSSAQTIMEMYGASVPFGMVKITTDMTGYAPAGYVTDNTQFVRGLSPLHDSGTGSNLGSYGNFEIMPLICSGGFDTCTPNLAGRERLRMDNTDDASPGYFSLTLNNSIRMEATSTRRAGLERFTFPNGNTPFFTLDLSNDLPNSFKGGNMTIDPEAGRITIGGFWGSSFGPESFTYQAFACYDLNNDGQNLGQFGIWTVDPNGDVIRGLGETQLMVPANPPGDNVIESGALFSFAGDPTRVIIRVGVSFISEQQACANAESEIGTATFDQIQAQSKALWNEKLSRIEIDVPHTPPNMTELLYSSLYRASLTPNNATGEAQGDFLGTRSFYFDSLYCSWDTFRTFYPLMALHSPEVYAQIVVATSMVTARGAGCRNVARITSLAGHKEVPVAMLLWSFCNQLPQRSAGVGNDLAELYAAQVADAEVNPPGSSWNVQGRQSDIYNKYGYIPVGVGDTSSSVLGTREGSRTLEYAFEDFAIRQVALLLNKTADEAKYANRSLNYRNIWDPDVTSDDFRGFMQRRFPNGTFATRNPADCSPKDNQKQDCDISGFYESSSWEYSWFVPHDMAHLVNLMGGNTPIGYHYTNAPASSVDAIRKSVFTNFDITPAGLPGNDDQAAMATWLIWHLLGFYPDSHDNNPSLSYVWDALPKQNKTVPGTSELLIVSPMIPKYTVHNRYLNISTTVTVKGFDARSLQETIPPGAAAYVQSVSVTTSNGDVTMQNASRCNFDFYDTFRVGADILITVTADRDAANSCGVSLPQSISTGGFAKAR
ncbi:glycoside hydrolase family 92 protein [Russula aff. rugulosa BPL654]|nr:glycoside hydrolase family 92 protein [Russula aff. rugulosa BPL654]